MAGMLLWPAVWNGYPIVFADSGTYLSQAVHRYLGWDRPPFYSLFMLPLHWTVTTWPVVVAQAVLTSWVLALVWRMLAPARSPRWLIPGAALLAVGTWLPWLVSELMPDVFTPLLVLTFCLLAFAPDRLARWERVALVPLVGFMIAAQQSSVAVWCGLLVGVGVWGSISPDTPLLARRKWFRTDRPDTPPLPLRAWAAKRTKVGGRGGNPPIRTAIPLPPYPSLKGRGGVEVKSCPLPSLQSRAGRSRLATLFRSSRLLLLLLLAVSALCAVNLAGHGRFALSPFGNVFLLARLIADGPARATLQARCPDAAWRLCPFTETLPDDSDEFLWSATSPILAAGGHKAISAEASAIIAATLRDHPAEIIQSAARNSLKQLWRMQSGDGLEPWPLQVTPWITRDFPPAEQARHAAARQQTSGLSVPFGLATAHGVVAWAGAALCLVLLFTACRQPGPHAGFLAVALLILPLSAVVTGALSCPHDRYQARVAWLPALVGVATLLGRPPVRAAPKQAQVPT